MQTFTNTELQAFNVRSEAGISGWVSGTLQLPPEAIKDSEYVPHSTQHYVVEDGQPNALEFAIALPKNEVRAESAVGSPCRKKGLVDDPLFLSFFFGSFSISVLSGVFSCSVFSSSSSSLQQMVLSRFTLRPSSL